MPSANSMTRIPNTFVRAWAGERSHTAAKKATTCQTFMGAT